MTDRMWCHACERWIGGGIGHTCDLHDLSDEFLYATPEETLKKNTSAENAFEL